MPENDEKFTRILYPDVTPELAEMMSKHELEIMVETAEAAKKHGVAIRKDVLRTAKKELERRGGTMEREEPYTTIDECLEETKADIMGRCANIPRAHLKDCVQVHEGTLEDIRMWLLNEEDLYNKGPHSVKWPKIRRETIEYSYHWCEKAFKPDAEEEIKKLQTPTGDKAKDLANALWVPFVEQFTEIPRDERIAMTDECKRTVKFSIEDMETCLKEKWPRSGR